MGFVYIGSSPQIKGRFGPRNGGLYGVDYIIYIFKTCTSLYLKEMVIQKINKKIVGAIEVYDSGREGSEKSMRELQTNILEVVGHST